MFISSLNSNHLAANTAVGGIPDSVKIAKNTVNMYALFFIRNILFFTFIEISHVITIRLVKYVTQNVVKSFMVKGSASMIHVMFATLE